MPRDYNDPMRSGLQRHAIPLICAAVACSYRDTGRREVVRTFTVTAVGRSPTELVLAPVDCPTETVLVDLAPSASRSKRHQADHTCLTSFEVGATVALERQRERQGCMPGMVFYELLGGCVLGELEVKSKGPACAPQPR